MSFFSDDRPIGNTRDPIEWVKQSLPSDIVPRNFPYMILLALKEIIKRIEALEDDRG